MRIWVKPDRLAQLKLTPIRSHPRDQRAERAIRRRQDRADADHQGTGSRLHDHDAGPALRRQGVRADHRPRESRWLDGSPERRRAHRARLQGLRLHRPLQRQAGNAGRHLPAAGRQRARSREERAQDDDRAVDAIPGRPHLRGALRHHALRRSVDPRSRLHARRGDGPGDPRRVPLPAKLARDADPAGRRSGVAAGRVRRPVRARLFDQHADAVRHGAGDRHRRRRRDRRAGERRADHARGRTRRRAKPRSRRCTR